MAIIFSPDPIVSGQTFPAATDIYDLRRAVNAVRALSGLAAATFTDATLTDVVVKAAHITELRAALAAARTALALSPVSYWNNPIAAGVVIDARDIMEIRGGVK